MPATTGGISGRTSREEQFIVTGGGMQAIQLALQATAGAGDEVLYLTPGLAELCRPPRR